MRDAITLRLEAAIAAAKSGVSGTVKISIPASLYAQIGVFMMRKD